MPADWMASLARGFEVVTLEPQPLRFVAQQVMRRSVIGDAFPFLWRMRFGGLPRPHYAYCMQRGAALAAALGIPRISVLELGVAGGNGLLNMERHALELERHYPVHIDVYGFDSGVGLPPCDDPRDLPYRWRGGLFSMDREALEGKLTRATLVLGDVAETVSTFGERFGPAPIAAIAFDLDYFSSTLEGLRLFELDPALRLPRVSCYVDDITDTIDGVGVLEAIAKFNAAHPRKPLGPLRGNLPGFRTPPPWKEYIYELHDLDHPRYADHVRVGHDELPLAPSRPQ